MTQEEFNKLKDDKFKVINNMVCQMNRTEEDDNNYYNFSGAPAIAYRIENNESASYKAAPYYMHKVSKEFLDEIRKRVDDFEEFKNSENFELNEENAIEFAIVESLKIDLIDYKLKASERTRKVI